jgi:hypothetical protein
MLRGGREIGNDAAVGDDLTVCFVNVSGKPSSDARYQHHRRQSVHPLRRRGSP